MTPRQVMRWWFSVVASVCLVLAFVLSPLMPGRLTARLFVVGLAAYVAVVFLKEHRKRV